MSTTTASVGTAYRIVRWRELYEVDDKGAKARAEGQLRQSPLEFVRFQVHGRSMGAGYRRLQQRCGTAARLEATFAVWSKLLELAGCETAEFRGWVLDERHQPATADDIVFFTGFRKSSIEFALAALSDKSVQWIEMAEFRSSPEVSGGFRDSPEVSGGSPEPFKNVIETETESEMNLNRIETKDEEQTECQTFDSILPSARSSGSDSPPAAGSPSPADGGRTRAGSEYSEIIAKLTRGSDKQRRADETVARGWWSDHIWPAGSPPTVGLQRFERFKKLVAKAGSNQADKPMAYITKLMPRGITE